MSENFFVTGAPKAGKTTILARIVDELRAQGLKVGGFLSPEEKQHGTRTGFYIEDIETGKRAMLASVNAAAEGPKVSKYHVDVKSFENIVRPIMEKSNDYDVVVIDEIGMMELKSNKFVDKLDGLMESKKPIIASLHKDLISKYGNQGEILYLTEDNREMVFNELVEKVKKSMAEEAIAKLETKQGKTEKKQKKQKSRRESKGELSGKKKTKNEKKTWDEGEERGRRGGINEGEKTEIYDDGEQEDHDPDSNSRARGKKKGVLESIMDLLGL